MNKGRLEAFSDGVIAIIITIMVLDLRVPHGSEFSDLTPLVPIFLSYVLSFVNVGIYWNNHHHILHAAHRVTPAVLWSNLHLLFWLSIVPFTTGWMGENHFAALPTAVYGLVLLMAASSYVLLQRAIIAADGPNSPLAQAVGADRKGLISRLIYLLAIPAAFWHAWISDACYVLVALIWFIPDPRIAKQLAGTETAPPRSPHS